jgi:HK97 family phage portal protein
MYANSPAVRTVVDLIARNVAQLDLRLYEEIGHDDRQERPDHPAMLSLRYPNDSTAPDQFIWALVANFLVSDNSYATKHRSGRADDPIQFMPIPPQRMEVGGRGLLPEGYRVQMVNGDWFPAEGFMPPSDVLHWRSWNAMDPRIGISRLETLRTVVAEEAAVQAALMELVKSGLAEPSWVFRDIEAPEWSPEARERFEEDLASRLRHSGSRPPVLEEGMELKGFGVSPRNAQMLEVRKYALQQVASLYGVPLGMVGLAEPVEEAQSEFYADTLPPICEELCRQLNLSVLQQEYDETELYFEFDLDEKLMGDERLKSLTSAAGVAVMTRNEARAKLNLPPVEGGDEPITPLNVMIGDNPKPSPQVMPPQNPAGPSQEGEEREPKGASMELPDEAELATILSRTFSRQFSAKKSAGHWQRWDHELATDLINAGLPDKLADRFAREVNETSRKALEGDRPGAVFTDERANLLAAKAAMLTRSEHPSLKDPERLARLESLRNLGLPSEVLWEMAGFNEEEIARMSSLSHAQELMAATNGSDSSGASAN